MMASVRRVMIASSVLLMGLAVPGYSQETTGTILGALVDQTGGVLPWREGPHNKRRHPSNARDRHE